MAINLSTLITPVRTDLADLPVDYIRDISVFQSIRQADKFIETIIKEDVEEDYRIYCTIVLGAYYTYLNYTDIAEKRLGHLPSTTLVRLNELKKKARMFLLNISNIGLTEDLMPTGEGLKNIRPIGIGLIDTVTTE